MQMPGSSEMIPEHPRLATEAMAVTRLDTLSNCPDSRPNYFQLLFVGGNDARPCVIQQGCQIYLGIMSVPLQFFRKELADNSSGPP